MYDIRQFRPTLYWVLLLGATAFAFSAELPLLWFASITAILINWRLVKRDRFKPMPRWAANAVTVFALLYVVQQTYVSANPPLMFIGQFLVVLQLVKLYEVRANRDFAQILVLSLLLMVASAINSTSILFGLLLLAYLTFALYCCLLFHLKVESDNARSALAIPPEQVNPASHRRDQR